MQAFIVAIVLSASAVYAVYRLYQTWHQASDPCAGCEGCALRKERNKTCTEKKVRKKFGRFE